MALDWGLHSASLINVSVGQMLISLAGMGLAANQPKATILATHILISSLKEALGSAHLAAVREPLGLFRKDGKSPDGLTLIPWSNEMKWGNESLKQVLKVKNEKWNA